MLKKEGDFAVTLPNGKKYALRDDGSYVWAREEGTTEDMEECVFEYVGHPIGVGIVRELLRLTAGPGISEEAAYKQWMDSGAFEKKDFYEWCAETFVFRMSGYGPGHTPMSVSGDWKSDGTGFRG